MAIETGSPQPVVEEENEPLPIGHVSMIGVDEGEGWREKYKGGDCHFLQPNQSPPKIPNCLSICVPGPFNRAMDFEIDEVPVYEGFLESGFRD
uniref:Uncharacterized protein n=1 Tax=Brassica campestris TaxID=3711 RepID=A0A3P6C9Z8_BRACM|nr:unnamed protein product [Brassica rapa]